MQKNNGQKRRAVKASQKVAGKKVPYNPGATRQEKRSYLGAFIVCEKCGDKMLRRNMPEHVRKARLHV